MRVKDCLGQVDKGFKALNKEDQIYRQKLAEMAKRTQASELAEARDELGKE